MIELTLSWYCFYGRIMNMSRQEILITPIGEMRDMIACLSIYHGARPKRQHKKLSFMQTLGVS